MVRYGISFSDQLCSELVYADDTLMVGQSIQGLQKYMDYIGAVGKKYDLSLNLQKIEKMDINTTESIIYDGNGQSIKSKINMKYLGAI